MTHRTSKAVLTFICILLIFGGSIYILGRNHNNSVEKILADNLDREIEVFEEFTFETNEASSYIAVGFEDENGVIGYGIFENREHKFFLLSLKQCNKMAKGGSQIYTDYFFDRNAGRYTIFLINHSLVSKLVWSYGNNSGEINVNELPSIYVLEGPEPGVATLQYKFVDEAGEEVH